MASNQVKWHSVTVDNEGHDLRLSFTMRNFLDYVCEQGEKLETSRMGCDRGCGVKWMLQVFPYGQSRKKKNDISVFLKLVSKPEGDEIVKATVNFYLLGKGGNQFKTVGPWEFEEDQLRTGYGCPKLVTRSELALNKDLYLPNGHFTVRCEGKVFFKNPTQIRGPIFEVENLPKVVTPNPSSNVLKKIYEEEICCDVVLKAGSKAFKCHKSILAANSMYFEDMFEHDLKEKREIVVELRKDLEEGELKMMLDYMYLREIDFANLSLASVQNLFRLSDTYEIDDLKEACESRLIAQLNKDVNLNLLMIFGIEHHAERLKKAVAKIMAK